MGSKVSLQPFDDTRSLRGDTVKGKVTILDHPLIQHKLSIMRAVETSTKDFRDLVNEISLLMTYEATRDLPLIQKPVRTQMGMAECKRISGRKLAVVPILRAGLGMVDGVLDLIPSARVGHIGLYRDEGTLMPVKYYSKLPKDLEHREVFIVDPMLATGGSACDAISQIKLHRPQRIIFMCIIAAPEGLKLLTENHPDVDVYCAALDDRLNDFGYVVPGVGDAGDRMFGTK